MTWIVGIDEAGYGPNLGPLVMSSATFRVQEENGSIDLWEVYRPVVRRHFEPEDGRLMVEDSKIVYSTRTGIHDLESSILAFGSPPNQAMEFTLNDYVEQVCGPSHVELRAEQWYSGTTPVPVVAARTTFEAARTRLKTLSRQRHVSWGFIRSVVVCPSHFNQILDRWNSKGAVLGHALGVLLRANRGSHDGGDPMVFTIDKHGGRNTYAAMLQDALGEGMVVAHEEGMERSSYTVLGLDREMRLTFQPRADGEHFCVALASMASKYLRELLMLEFNRFWQEIVPGLKPTAGYPGDADRYYQAILPAAKQRDIPEASLWRRR
jgi:ribonuclease HII